jgi:Holliday junction resolvase RusA-like endonuclease
MLICTVSAKVSAVSEYDAILIRGLNPEPWTVGTITQGFAGKRRYATIAKDERLRIYQEGIAECVREAYPNLRMWPEDIPLELQFKFCRQLDQYTSGKGRKAKRHIADATNMTKALEDALQGILYKNDSQVKHSSGEIILEGPDVEPMILVLLREHVLDPAWKRLMDHLSTCPRPTPPGNIHYTRLVK